MSEKSQLVVVGAGPGGYAAAFYAADLGMQVTLIDLEKNPGGVCLHRGCIPSKAYLHIAKLINEAKHAEKWGVKFSEPEIDINKVREYKENVVEKLTTGNGGLVKQRKITYHQGKATFTSSNTLTVALVDGGSVDVEFEKAIVATGSTPAIIPGLSIDSPRVMDSTGALELKDLPESLLVVGGGIIGFEMASVYSTLGSKVTVVELLPQVLTGADKDLARTVVTEVGKTGVEIFVNTKVASLKEVENGIEAVLEGAGIENPVRVFDKVLVSIGRTPSTKGLGLENTKAIVTDRGFIEVNKKMQTADPSIYAIGDVVGQPMLAHKAHAEGKVAVDNIIGHEREFAPKCIPSVVYTDPELAWAGITEAEAKEKGIKVETFRFPWAANGRSLAQDRTDGTTKLLVNPDTEVILGVGIVGPGAGELLAEGALAVEMGLKVKDIAHLIHAHPTVSETVMEVAEMFYGTSTHVYRPKRKK